MSVQPTQALPVAGQFGIDADIFTMIGPVVQADASGGTVQANANTKFNTNIPLNYAMAITEIDWNWSFDKAEAMSNSAAITHWYEVVQITESLNRTATQSDPLNVDYAYKGRLLRMFQSSGASITVAMIDDFVLERHIFRHPWLTVAQQLNQVLSVVPRADNATNGPEVSAWAKLYFKLIAIDANVRSYLATRIQITSQV